MAWKRIKGPGDYFGPVVGTAIGSGNPAAATLDAVGEYQFSAGYIRWDDGGTHTKPPKA